MEHQYRISYVYWQVIVPLLISSQLFYPCLSRLHPSSPYRRQFVHFTATWNEGILIYGICVIRKNICVVKKYILLCVLESLREEQIGYITKTCYIEVLKYFPQFIYFLVCFSCQVNSTKMVQWNLASKSCSPIL